MALFFLPRGGCFPPLSSPPDLSPGPLRRPWPVCLSSPAYAAATCTVCTSDDDDAHHMPSQKRILFLCVCLWLAPPLQHHQRWALHAERAPSRTQPLCCISSSCTHAQCALCAQVRCNQLLLSLSQQPCWLSELRWGAGGAHTEQPRRRANLVARRAPQIISQCARAMPYISPRSRAFESSRRSQLLSVPGITTASLVLIADCCGQEPASSASESDHRSPFFAPLEHPNCCRWIAEHTLYIF